MSARLSHHHRHKRFHVPLEAKGIGYHRFLVPPLLAPGRRRGEESETTDADLEALETERRVARRGAWVCVIALFCVMMWLWARFGPVISITPVVRPDLIHF